MPIKSCTTLLYGDRLKGDERILGDSECVQFILIYANNHFEQNYELQRLEYDLNSLADKVASIFAIEPHEIFRQNRQKST